MHILSNILELLARQTQTPSIGSQTPYTHPSPSRPPPTGNEGFPITCVHVVGAVVAVQRGGAVLPQRQQVGVGGARRHRGGVAAAPVVPLRHQAHHQVLELRQLGLPHRGGEGNKVTR